MATWKWPCAVFLALAVIGGAVAWRAAKMPMIVPTGTTLTITGGMAMPNGVVVQSGATLRLEGGTYDLGGDGIAIEEGAVFEVLGSTHAIRVAEKEPNRE